MNRAVITYYVNFNKIMVFIVSDLLPPSSKTLAINGVHRPGGELRRELELVHGCRVYGYRIELKDPYRGLFPSKPSCGCDLSLKHKVEPRRPSLGDAPTASPWEHVSLCSSPQEATPWPPRHQAHWSSS